MNINVQKILLDQITEKEKELRECHMRIELIKHNYESDAEEAIINEFLNISALKGAIKALNDVLSILCYENNKEVGKRLADGIAEGIKEGSK